ncbi:MAG: mevalonate kinase [Alphaproteobacteria bacterium]|nr:mevalonate kinase [Alphaproteobacteria bacterium]
MEFLASGKWILTGEHAVLRGHPAIVFPLPHFYVKLSYTDSGLALLGDSLIKPLKNTLMKGCAILGKSLNAITGDFLIEGNIPLGFGLGSSAALCHVVGQWFLYKGWVQREQLFEFCCRLEDVFHGCSSGLDILGSFSTTGVYYQHDRDPTPIQQTWKPLICLSLLSVPKDTSKAIEIVRHLNEQNPTLGQQIDHKMHHATDMAKDALSLDKQDGLPLLAASLNQACDCFYDWGLVNQPLYDAMQALRGHSPLAIKPTGAGLGGSVISLWAEHPPAIDGLIPLF